jgi:hypothetical protein
MRRFHPNRRLEETSWSRATIEIVMPGQVVSSTSRTFSSAV